MRVVLSLRVRLPVGGNRAFRCDPCWGVITHHGIERDEVGVPTYTQLW